MDVRETVANILIEKTTLRLGGHQFAMDAVGSAKILVDVAAAKLQFQQKCDRIVAYRS